MPFFKGLNTSSINLQIMSTQGFKHNWYNSALEEHKSALKAQQYLAPLGLHREWKLATAADLSAEHPREGNVLNTVTDRRRVTD